MRAPLLALSFALGACQTEGTGAADAAPLPAGAETRSLSGIPLYPPPLAPDVRRQQEAELAAARAEFAAEPSLEHAVWLGRRTAYLGLYREAVAIYTDALREYPDAAELYRHRGHRHITLRDFSAAIADLERAADLVQGSDDVIEADGQPNERGIPMTTLNRNIYYHLGLAHYLAGDLDSALAAYRRCLELSATPDARVSTTHWLYVILRRLGRDAGAEELLAPIHAGLDIVENQAYFDLLLMYRGEKRPEDLLSGEDPVTNATATYGVGAFYLHNGDRQRAREIFESIVAREQWGAFGHIAAEADLQRW